MTARIAGFITREQAGLVLPRQVSHNVWPERGGVAVHHGGDPVPVRSHAECVARWRAWQAFHMDPVTGRGWSDIAYNGGVCDHGYALAGRGWGVRSAAQGTNDGNDRFVAVCHINTAPVPTPAAYDAFEWWVTTFRKAGAGAEVLPHYRFHSTSCPGNVLGARALGSWNGKPLTPDGPPPDRRAAMVAATQRAVHVPADGKWGAGTDDAVDAVRDALDGRFANATTCRAAQRAVGADDDGTWGPSSRAHLTSTVAVLQVAWRWANPALASDGVWGPGTGTAYLACRRAAFGKF